MDTNIIKLLEEGNIEELKKIENFDVNKILKDEHGKLFPLWIALIKNNIELIKFLISKGVLFENKTFSAFLSSVSYCDHDIIKYLAENGADIHASDNFGEAFATAIFNKRNNDILLLIHELGHTVEQYAGIAFRHLIGINKITSDDQILDSRYQYEDRIYEVLDFFTSRNVDVNYNKNNMLYHLEETPLCISARYQDLKRCKYLVEHGADITLADKEGKRPYRHAIEAKKNDIAEYLKSLEPEDVHKTLNKIESLRTYKLPKKMLDFLQQNILRVELPDTDFKFIEFLSLTAIEEFRVNRNKFLLLSKNTGHYSNFKIVWMPKITQFGCYDEENKQVHEIGTFDQFLKI